MSSFYSGIGLALCERLLAEHIQVRLCLACRNMQRARAARSALLASHSEARVDLLQLDVGSVQSVLTAARELKARSIHFLVTLTWQILDLIRHA